MLEKYEISDNKKNSLIISVAMCTYNGGKYLQEQLNSIAKQTRLPDEFVVCDDGSADSTLQILDEFKKNTTSQVRIYHNEKKLGYTKNFEKAINLCKGDIIALSDQDDVWLPHKLEKIEKLFEKYPNAGYAFSDAIVVDEKLNPLGYTLWKSILFTTYQRRLFKNGYQLEVLLKHNVVTGATMAFRAENRDLILPISNQWVHDAWIVLLSSALGIKGDFIEEPLIRYRQHHQQSTMGGRRLNLHEQFQQAYKTRSESYKIMANEFECIIKRLNSMHKLTKKDEKLFETKIEHLKIRQKIYSYKKWKCYHLICREFLNGHYHRFSNGWKSIVKDLCL
jgi:glycosyltransferase involved in cell wall biosynthesis